jgi:hypothetical protein
MSTPEPENAEPKTRLQAMKAELEAMGSHDVTSQYLGKALIAPGFLQKHLEKERQEDPPRV